MNDIDAALAVALDRLAPPAAAALDWNDVLTRAGHRRRPAGVLVTAVVLATVALLATPALGIGGKVGELLGIRSGPRPGFVAALAPVAGSGAGSVVATPTSAFTPVGSKRSVGFARSLAVTIRFSGLSGPATLGLVRIAPPPGSSRGGYVIRLCGPCHSAMKAVIHRPGLFLTLMAGRGTVEIATAAHPGGELRGRLHAT